MRSSQISYARSQDNLELHMLRSMANIEVKKFAYMVSAIGADTLAAISRAGPETQVSFYRISSIIRQSFFPSKTIPKI